MRPERFRKNIRLTACSTTTPHSVATTMIMLVFLSAVTIASGAWVLTVVRPDSPGWLVAAAAGVALLGW